MKRIYVPTKSIESWKSAMKDGERQFQDGYSAKTLARCWEESNGFPNEILKVFRKSGIETFKDIDILFAFPEYMVKLEGKGGQSVNDLFVLARNEKDLLSIMVEGKVNESFGSTINNWLKNSSENKQTRLNSLCNLLNIDRNKVDNNKIRYQLLHRTASSILEAKRTNSKYAVMMVHSFSEENKGFEDYKNFVKLFGVDSNDIEVNSIIFAKEIDGIKLFFSWVNGDKKLLKLSKKKVVGVDGCKFGWVSVCIDNDDYEVNLFSTFDDLWERYKNASLILIDIPIGLKESKEQRLCDYGSRKILKGNRKSSVFSVPCRDAIYSKNYEEANRVNRELTGKGISKQSWAISNKIKELDTFLRKNKDARSKIKESHPEVCFLTLSGKSMEYNKTTSEGFNERLRILDSIYLKSEEIINNTLEKYLRKDVQRDDIVDALCLALTAQEGLRNSFSYIPRISEKDSEGLDMQILCYEMTKLRDF